MITSADIKDYVRDLFELIEVELDLIEQHNDSQNEHLKIIKDNLIEKQTILTKMLNLITNE
jgi:hypothetical protein